MRINILNIQKMKHIKKLSVQNAILQKDTNVLKIKIIFSGYSFQTKKEGQEYFEENFKEYEKVDFL
ncbi:hypothetical protein [Campylobacter insulaenigrae]|uniref:hypothetical protein n=1 Tax=Campylobacter insulaenigrae TaxID=260714 RepID=UPI0021521785|nr:hypothetical protein [Campylobacter insulaenigrae]MCR6588432.1 hypothetical protein [Campylobacter insulaenigrae]